MASPTAPPVTSTDTSVTRTFSTWLEELTPESIPIEIRTRAKYLILDGLACALLGTRLPWSVKAHDAITAIEGRGKCTVIGWNESLTPSAAALLNSTFLQGFDLDDVHIEAPIHASSVVIPAVLAAAEQEDSSTNPISGNAFLTAMVAGYETGPRVGYALGGSHMLTIGWHSGAIFGPAASAAAVSKLLNLPAAQIEDALGMACTQACGLMSAQFESMVKRMQHGFASRSGLLATYLAKQGVTGIKDVFDSSSGSSFLKMYTLGAESEKKFFLEEICKGLGETWHTRKVRQKPYALMAGTHCTVDCLRVLQAKYPEKMRDWKKMVKIEAEMARAAMKKGGWHPEKPATVTAAQMCVPYAVALQVVDGEVVPAQFAPGKLNREELWQVMGMVECREVKEFDHSWAQRVKITFEDGEVLETMLKAPRGVNPELSNEEVVEKWRAVTRGVISEERQRKIEETVLNLETVDDVAAVLGELLRGETTNVLQ
ncbi:hypothetical protein AbraIFM66951_009941 [Aspergillus brasiliensis]|uniref:Immune-responsive protein n=1 Tax=Aspergillus brasiliensis TaxID=319629 RepID=A0A9W5YY38_9EURO|nr:hypothetical protein AbraCBS73388_001715 [Aspergillus brasiliensis]GKZ46786.1 hypothetical protein AbraIFM66951_009941 [Aspergillus brasiliensis]